MECDHNSALEPRSGALKKILISRLSKQNRKKVFIPETQSSVVGSRGS